MVRKPFDPALYNSDDDAKHQVIEWLRAQGFEAWVNPDQYGIDVLATRNGIDYSFEVEVKHGWSGTTFPYDSVHISARKLKFVGDNTYYMMLNHERTALLKIRADDVAEARIVNKKTVYTDEEDFISVPVWLCKLRLL